MVFLAVVERPPPEARILAPDGVRGFRGVETLLLVPPVKVKTEAGLPPLLAVCLRDSASFLMPRNWNWMPSAVDSPKNLAISVFSCQYTPYPNHSKKVANSRKARESRSQETVMDDSKEINVKAGATVTLLLLRKIHGDGLAIHTLLIGFPKHISLILESSEPMVESVLGHIRTVELLDVCRTSEMTSTMVKSRRKIETDEKQGLGRTERKETRVVLTLVVPFDIGVSGHDGAKESSLRLVGLEVGRSHLGL